MHLFQTSFFIHLFNYIRFFIINSIFRVNTRFFTCTILQKIFLLYSFDYDILLYTIKAFFRFFPIFLYNFFTIRFYLFRNCSGIVKSPCLFCSGIVPELFRIFQLFFSCVFVYNFSTIHF